MTAPVGMLPRQRRAMVKSAARLRRRGVAIRLEVGGRGPVGAGLLRVTDRSYWRRAAGVMGSLSRALRVRAPRPVPGACARVGGDR